MRDRDQTIVFPIFGGSYVAERHDHQAVPMEKNKGRAMKVVAAAGLLAFGITTATAITKNIRSQASDSLWGQSPRALSIPVPGMGGFEQALY